MTQTETLDDVREMFREMVREDRQRREEMAREREEMVREDRQRREKMAREREEMVREQRERWVALDRRIEETSCQMKETDRQMKETDRQMKETDRQMKETDRRIEETDRQMKETDLRMQETDRKVKEVSKQIGNLGGRWGEFVEGLVAPACTTLFAQRGIPVHITSRNVKAKFPGNRHMEIDVLVVNTDAVVLVEVKSALTAEHVREHLTRLAEFKNFFPVYADKRVIGAVAGIVIEEGVDRFAINQGLFVIVQSGDTVCMANDETFVPRTW